ncbi:MAG: DUF2975 domain-containing protein [Pseudomonadota bacterium]
MPTHDLARFRRMCGQFRGLAIFMVFSVGAVLALMYVVAPLVLGLRGTITNSGMRMVTGLIFALPSICYLFGVWSIGRALGEVAKGRLIQPALADGLRRVGLALGVGGLLAVFAVTNLLRLIGETKGGYLNFDVASMTLGMIGGALFLLGRVADQAARVQAELDEMI